MLKNIGRDAARPFHSSDNCVRASGAPPGRSDVEANKKSQQIIGRPRAEAALHKAERCPSAYKAGQKIHSMFYPT